MTIRDVAEAAGVSPSTVSNALNNRAGVDAATKERVEREAERLGYSANPSARRLRSGRSGSLGLVLPQIANPEYAAGIYYYARFIEGASVAAFRRGVTLTLVPPGEPGEEVLQLPVDGLLMADPPAGHPVLAAFRKAGRPVVTIERDPSHEDDPWWVGADTLTNTHTALDHLAASGSRRIALVGRSNHTWTSDTDAAYESWCAARGHEPLKIEVDLSHDDRAAAALIRDVLTGPNPPDGIFAAPEWFATAAVRTARGLGLEIPGDLRVAAGSDGDRAYDCDPPVTSIDLHPRQVAAAAVELLLARIENAEVVHPRVVHATLNVRASTYPSAGRGSPPS